MRSIIRTATALAVAAACVNALSGGQRTSSAAGLIAPHPYTRATIADTNFPVPHGALFVAPNGRDANPGTLVAPLATLRRAIAIAPTGGTIVARGGVYRESLGRITRRVTIQAYPHEHPWVQGSVVASPFTRSNDAWSTPFTTAMCDRCFPSGALAFGYPAAGLPEQAFLDGAPLVQVTLEAALAPGRFWVDRRGGRLWIGDDPAGHTVEITTRDTAFIITASAEGTAIRGLGFQHWATVYQGQPRAAATSTADFVTFDSDTFAWSASRGLAIYADNNVVRNSRFLNNGMNGVTSHRARGLDFEHNEVAYSNYEHWNITPSATAEIAGAKLTRMAYTMMRRNDFHDNFSNGLWFDMVSYGQTIVSNSIQRNLGHGLTVEVSGQSIVADNVIAENVRDGMKIAGANDIEIWNNTVVDNGWAQLGLYEDPRHTAPPATSDTGKVRISNNIFHAGPRATKPVLYNVDASRSKHLTFAQMVSFEDHNNWGRTDTGSPAYTFSVQAATLAGSARYRTLADFARAFGRERSSSSSDGMSLASLFRNPAVGDYSLSPGATATVPMAQVPPISVAWAIGLGSIPSHAGAG